MKTQVKLPLLIPFLLACNGLVTDPLAKYPGLKSGAPTDQKSPVQTIVQPDLFSLDITGTNEINSVQFTEGQLSSVQLRVSPKSGLIKTFSVELLDFTNPERPNLSQGESEQHFSLVWTPPAGTIPSGQWGKTFQAKIKLTVLDAANSLLVGTVNTKTIDIVVNRNQSQPKLVGHSNLSIGVTEGQSLTFTVDVDDPGSNQSPRLPEVQITPYIYANTEAYRANGSQYVIYDDSRKDNPERITSNVWRFYYLIQVTHLPLNRDRLGNEIPNSPNVDVCFLMRAVSSLGTLSDQQQICTKANYAIQPTPSEGASK